MSLFTAFCLGFIFCFILHLFVYRGYKRILVKKAETGQYENILGKWYTIHKHH